MEPLIIPDKIFVDDSIECVAGLDTIEIHLPDRQYIVLSDDDARELMGWLHSWLIEREE